MTLNIALFLTIIAFVWAVASVYYQSAVRPFVQDTVHFRIFRTRDHLRQMAIAGDIDPTSFSFRHLEGLLNQMISTSRWYSVSSLIEFHVLHRDVQPSADIARFDSEATAELKKLESTALDAMLVVMAVNSPGWIIFSLAIFTAAALKRHAIKSWIRVQNRTLWYETRHHGLSSC